MDWKHRLVRFRSFWIFPGLSVLFLILTHRLDANANFDDFALFFPAGVLTWTFLEYTLHRFVFHVEIEDPHMRDLVNGSHTQHHQLPQDATHILVHTTYAFGVSALVYGLAFLILRSAFDAMALMAGIWAGFLYYESVHYRVHVTGGNTGLIRLQRRAHYHHHFRDPDVCFGVTTPVWDYVFGTNRKVTPSTAARSRLQ
jgi:sterol desaturase/sphingolipid hydroxylase (fatty acid hydroxylase superfamily)